MHATPASRRTPRIALALALVALGLPAGAHAATQPAAQPKFPIPASERVHPSTTGSGAAPATTTPASVKAAGGAGATTPAVTTPAATTPAATTAVPATTRAAGARRTTASSTKLSTGAIVAAALAALLILVCLAWGAARWFAYEPRWSISLRHSLAEASWRLSASWDEFSDWARIGR